MDVNFEISPGVFDTTGYDNRTGYGIIKGGKTIENMLNPYQLYHYEVDGGLSVGSEYLSDFIVSEPNHSNVNILLPPTQAGVHEYSAEMHKVHKTIDLNSYTNISWKTTRVWGRGGLGTIGWSGSQPMLENGNLHQNNFQHGWCRVIGAGNPNQNNIKDISFDENNVTLETYCYKVFDKLNNNTFIGWFPCPPDAVKYQITVWGEETILSVEYDKLIDGKLNLKIENANMFGNNYIIAEYSTVNLGPIDFKIFDLNGQIVKEFSRDVWSGEKINRKSINLSELPNGTYILNISDGQNVESQKFIVNR